MKNEIRNEIRDAVLLNTSVNHPQSFREIATAIRTVEPKSFSGRDSEILSVIYPMINSGELQYTSDLKLVKSSTEA